MSVWYLDPVNGLDATTATPYGWWSVAYTSGNGTQPTNEAVTGATSGSTATITYCTVSGGTWAGGDAAGTLYFFGKSAAFQAETLNITGGATCAIGGDFTYCAWRTMASGATAARTAPGDTIRMAKSPAPVSLGNGTWTDNTRTVTLASAATSTIDNCETAWTAPTGVVTVMNTTPTAGGAGYTANDILTITTGGSLCTVKVSSVDGSGAVTGITALPVTGGHDYTTGAGKATTGGTGDGNCTVNITTVVTPTVSASSSSGYKREGTYSLKVQGQSVGLLNTKYCYLDLYTHDTTVHNLAAFQKLTYWVSGDANMAQTAWNICLCSDVLGDVVVDTIPFLPDTYSNPYWAAAITQARTGGGNFGSSIKSVALYSGSTAPTANKYVYLDNISATTTDGICLNSLISKRSEDDLTADVLNEGWWQISAINGVTLTIDYDNKTISTGKGYTTDGTTPQTCTTYFRNAFFVACANSDTWGDWVPKESGTKGNLITYEGGYNPVTNVREGMSIFGGWTGNTGGFAYNTTLSYLKYSYIGAYRGNKMFSHDVGNTVGGCVWDHCICGSFNTQSFYVRSESEMPYTLSNIGVYSGGDSSAGSVTLGCKLKACSGWYFYSISGVGLKTSGAGQFSQATPHSIDTVKILRALRGIQILDANLYITNLTIKNSQNAIAAEFTGGCKLFVRNGTFNDAAIDGAMDSGDIYDGIVSVTNYGGTTTDHRIYGYGYNAVYQSGIRDGASGGAWRVNITNVKRHSDFPVYLPLGKFACIADETLTVTAKFKKSHGTDIAAQLIIPSGQLAGITTETPDVKANDTDWEALTVTCLPTEAGVVEVFAQVWWLANTADENVVIDTITASQAA